MKRKLALTLGAASLSAMTLIGLGTATAGAAPAKDSAPASASAEIGLRAGKFYIYKDDNLKGGYYPFRKDDGYLSNNKWIGGPHAGRSINNGASSMKNNTDRWVKMWDHPDDGHECSGQSYRARPHTTDDDLTGNSFDNKASCVTFE